MNSNFRVWTLISAFLFLLSPVIQAEKVPRKSKKDQVVTINTNLGEIKLILFDQTPQHKANFLKLAESGFYDGTTFHRVIRDFMIQGGDPNTKDTDPNNDGAGQPDAAPIPAEIRPELPHKFGAVAAARQGDYINPTRASSASQFYIVQNHQGTKHLDGAYTVFGQVISGLDIIDKIAAQPTGPRDRPTTDVKMTVKVDKLKKKKITQLYGYQY
ncbi:hypothetical protein GCM10011375_03470 [Hymenobacter qilianensis]|uniref:Uncharacterized protein n=1 Tax=Hymenobacter qilianensis TaxID=1385715 RepID=A0ACB5PLU9_9BACT|nr:peptidylprolyl isomerase [Hymenobacter qilianensis]GGF51276.1 hypothetical protein GCM10011375_03470 [Hymenobacter qilianensis]